MSCHIFNRYWHKRLREQDVRFLLSVLKEKAEQWADGLYLKGTNQYEDEVRYRVNVAFDLHKKLPGNEHWTCECAGNWKIL